jgi:catecholate siderophore receptor
VTQRKKGARLPASFRTGNGNGPISLSRNTLALGMSSALMAPLATVAAEDVIDLDTLQIEERAVDTNPYAEPGAPYKAKVSGDERITRPLADTPYTITVLTKTEIEDSGYTDLREILDAQPGITLGTGENGNAFGDRYIIRGQEARSDVFVDGLRDPGMTIRESFATEQIEVSKGPNSSFAGRGTAGGAINSVTKQASTEYGFTKTAAAIGTDQLVRVTLDANQVFNDRFAVRMNALYSHEDIPDRAPTDRDRSGIALSGFVAATEKLDVTVDYYGFDAEDNPDIGGYLTGTVPHRKPAKAVPVYAQKQDFLKSDVNTVTARLDYGADEGVRIASVTRLGTSENAYVVTGARGSTTNASNPDGLYATTSLSTHQGWQDVRYAVNQTNLYFRPEIAGQTHDLIVGFELSDHGVVNGVYDVGNSGQNCALGNSATLNAWCATGPDGKPVDGLRTLMNRQIEKGRWDIDWNVDTMSLYLMDTFDVGEYWTLFAGLRMDSFDFHTVTQNAALTKTRYDYSDTLLNGHVGVVYNIRPDATVYLGYSTASDINGGESDVGSSCGYGGICVDPGNGVGVADSAPETTENIELGTKWNILDEKLLLNAAVFQITKDDVMEQTPNSPGYESLGAQNTGRNRVRGIEIGLTGNITDRLQGQAGASFMNAEVLESNNPAQVGKTLSNFADTTAFAQLKYAVTPALSVGGAVKYESKKYGGQPDSAPALTSNGKYAQPVPAYKVVDLFADYQFSRKVNLRMNIGNVLNEDYYLSVYRSGSFLYYGDAFNGRLTLNYEF